MPLVPALRRRQKNQNCKNILRYIAEFAEASLGYMCLISKQKGKVSHFGKSGLPHPETLNFAGQDVSGRGRSCLSISYLDYCSP